MPRTTRSRRGADPGPPRGGRRSRRVRGSRAPVEPRKCAVVSSSAVYQPRSSSAGPIDAISQSSTATGARSSPKMTLPMRTSPHSTELGGSWLGARLRHQAKSSSTTEGASPSKVHWASCSHHRDLVARVRRRCGARPRSGAPATASCGPGPARRGTPRAGSAARLGPAFRARGPSRGPRRDRGPRRGASRGRGSRASPGPPRMSPVRRSAPRARRRPAAPPPACPGRRSGTAPAPMVGGAPRADRGAGRRRPAR